MKTPSLALLLLLSASAFANPNAPKALHCTAKQTPIDTQTGAPQTPTNLLPDFEVKFEADTSQPQLPHDDRPLGRNPDDGEWPRDSSGRVRECDARQ